MKAVILAGGFATRMWPLTKDKPKQLLTVAGRPMLDYVMEKITSVPRIDQIFISTNAKFEDQFKEYLEEYETDKEISLVIEEVRSEEKKLGSVGALGYLITEKDIDGELLVIGGDNIFGFEMIDFIEYFHAKEGNVLALYDVESKAKAKLYGVIDIDKDNRVTYFQEKPEDPRSTLVSTACYAFTEKGTKNILKYLEGGNNPDEIGHFINWLYKKDDVYGYIFHGVWFDIGSKESYHKADKFLSENRLDTLD